MRQVYLVSLLALGLVLSGCASSPGGGTSSADGPETKSVPTASGKSTNPQSTSGPSSGSPTGSGSSSAPPSPGGNTTAGNSTEPIVIEGTTMRLAVFCEDSVHEVSGVDGWHYLLEADAPIFGGGAYTVFEIDGALVVAEEPVEGTVPAGVTGVKACTGTDAQGQSVDYKVTFTATAPAA